MCICIYVRTYVCMYVCVSDAPIWDLADIAITILANADSWFDICNFVQNHLQFVLRASFQLMIPSQIILTLVRILCGRNYICNIYWSKTDTDISKMRPISQYPICWSDYRYITNMYVFMYVCMYMHMYYVYVVWCNNTCRHTTNQHAVPG